MANVRDSLKAVMNIEGALGASIVHDESGVPLGTIGGGSLDMELAGAGSTVVVQTQKELLEDLVPEEQMEDILISLDQQYHLIRFFHDTENIFTYVVLDRADANLALARRKLAEIDRQLEIEDAG
ncbi:hypothetical protein BSZ35_08460 [Salinibacter sp. 10B]|uniref:hypothetical protein n=1 Tax=Salinibacter sp. 10B TaxID=1923971 RepID=UPI000CF57094|nr:hypothetical protein [Salinibacter sp. 10B]PQJ34626.1 hypothetical protein BSZ35_08460 [Salinibacter sp. 10B]